MHFRHKLTLWIRQSAGVAELDEPDNANPIAAAAKAAEHRLAATGLDPALAKRQAGVRIFGAKPGAYGAGLQAMIDEGIWETRGDLADAFLAWGGFAYGAGADGEAARDHLAALLSDVDAVSRRRTIASTIFLIRMIIINSRADWRRPSKRSKVPRQLSIMVITRARKSRWCGPCRRKSPGWCAAGRRIPNGSRESCATATRERSKWRRRWIISSPTRRRPTRSGAIISTSYTMLTSVIIWCAISSPTTIRRRFARCRRDCARQLIEASGRPRTNSAYDRLTELIGARHREAAQ